MKYYPKKHSDSAKRQFIVSTGDPSTGKSPRVRGILDEDTREVEMSFPLGYWGLPEIDDEVVVVDPFKDGMNRAIIGTVPNYMFDISPGDRLIYSANASILLQKNGNIVIVGGSKVTLKNNGGAEIVMNEDGVIDLN